MVQKSLQISICFSLNSYDFSLNTAGNSQNDVVDIPSTLPYLKC
jgi:hypothetical protein